MIIQQAMTYIIIFGFIGYIGYIIYQKAQAKGLLTPQSRIEDNSILREELKRLKEKVEIKEELELLKRRAKI